MRPTVRLISSMATKALLQDLAQTLSTSLNVELDVESVGGVVAKERVEQGESFDLACLASDALESLEKNGHLLQGSIRPFALSEVAVAIADASTPLSLETEADVKRAVLAARTIGYSTGPSGTAVLALFSAWGIADQVKDRLVQAQAGVPVAALIAKGQVELGFQQLSEMQGVSGIQVLGILPAECSIQTCFSLGVISAGTQQGLSQRVLDALNGPQTAALKQAHGMTAP